ncbi:unnamed protein product [Rhizophagus irregularis]|uniref:BED-type domain-containing protein n=1 Tax=Rhizophagus irregularis TaxID=588596 RepID=A0A916E3D7_9GLOM|nr:unnamed protein product [Rhizophagus irregularis]CAB5348607.1 unnamed protein product [Rhizophagus irregularis]
MIRKKERKKGPVWKHFYSISEHDDSHPHVQCIYCLKDFQRAVPERMQAHLDKKCPSAPNDAKSQSVQQNNSTSIIGYTDNINEEIVRRRGSVWKNFHIIGKYGDSHPSVQCNYCSKEFKRAVPQRMQTHIEKCEQVPNNVKSKLKQSRQQNTIKINNINDYMSEEEQKSLESLLAKALSSAKIQFSFVDNPFVIQFFNHLRPSFKLPNGEEIKIQMSQTQSLNDITYHPEYCHQFEIKTEDGSDIDTDSTIDLECESESEKRTIFESCKEAAEKDIVMRME